MEICGFEENLALTETEVETDTEVLFSVGESFKNYESLEKKLKDFEKASFSQFWKRDARTIKPKSIPNPNPNPNVGDVEKPIVRP